VLLLKQAIEAAGAKHKFIRTITMRKKKKKKFFFETLSNIWKIEELKRYESCTLVCFSNIDFWSTNVQLPWYRNYCAVRSLALWNGKWNLLES